jgi:acyl carrier protein
LNSLILDQVCGIASDVLGVPRSKVSADSSPKNTEAWDSTAHLNLVLALEEKYGVQLSPEEIEGMQSVGEAVAILEKKLPTASR